MSSTEVAVLKKQLTITPKTATLLIKAGYADYTSLATVSPDHVVKQFCDILRMPRKHASAYKRALRRIVWLGTQARPEDCPKICKNWSDKALRARGAWCNNFDQLTGVEIDARLKDLTGETTKRTESEEKMKLEGNV